MGVWRLFTAERLSTHYLVKVIAPLLMIVALSWVVFLAMIEVVITTGLARTERVKTARWMDRACRLLFPGALTLLAIYAFVWH